MTTIEPKAPAPGWAMRWADQASDLIMRSALPLLIGSLGFHLYVVPMLSLAATNLSLLPLTALLFVAVGRAFAMLHVFWVLQVLMRTDGHRPQQPLLSSESVRLMAPFYGIELLLVVIRGLLFGTLWSSGAAGASEGPAAPAPEGFEVATALAWIMGNAHQSSLLSVSVLMWVVGTFWAPLMVSMGVPLGTFFIRLRPMLSSRLGAAYATMTWMVFAYLVLITMLPFWLGQIGVVFGMAWIYVGAREMFGGIAENGRQEASAPMAVEAPSPS